MTLRTLSLPCFSGCQHATQYSTWRMHHNPPTPVSPEWNFPITNSEVHSYIRAPVQIRIYVDSLFLSIFPQVHTQNTGEELSDSTMSALLLITALSHLSAVTNQGGVMLSQRALQLLFTYVLATRFLSSEMSMRVSANFFYQVSFSFLQQLFIINSGYYAILVSNTSSELTSCLYFLLESSDKRC